MAVSINHANAQEEAAEGDTTAVYVCVQSALTTDESADSTIGQLIVFALSLLTTDESTDSTIELKEFDSLGFVFSQASVVTVYGPVTGDTDGVNDALFIRVIPRLIERPIYGTYRIRDNGLEDLLRTHPIDNDQEMPCGEQISSIEMRLASSSIRVESDTGIVLSTMAPEDEETVQSPDFVGSVAFHFPMPNVMQDFEVLRTSEIPFELAFPGMDSTDVIAFASSKFEGNVLNPDQQNVLPIGGVGQEGFMDTYENKEVNCEEIIPDGAEPYSECDDYFYEDVLIARDFKTVPMFGFIFELPEGHSIKLNDTEEPEARFKEGDTVEVNDEILGCGVTDETGNVQVKLYNLDGSQSNPLNGTAEIRRVDGNDDLPLIVDVGGTDFRVSGLCLRVVAP